MKCDKPIDTLIQQSEMMNTLTTKSASEKYEEIKTICEQYQKPKSMIDDIKEIQICDRLPPPKVKTPYSKVSGSDILTMRANNTKTDKKLSVNCRIISSSPIQCLTNKRKRDPRNIDEEEYNKLFNTDPPKGVSEDDQALDGEG